MRAVASRDDWEIGRRIVEFEQGGKGRAAYGEAVIRRLGADLSERIGRGFGWRNLAQMRVFYLMWPADSMAMNASSKLRPKVVELQKFGLAVVLEHTEAAVAKGALPTRPLRSRYRAKLRVRRPVEAGKD
ncbi:DUF1016 N-terminal domain-containing protein [Burkholderia cenocepacia]|uniref:DUF1016 N-terminal domain-containing protein n=1 Tax=Burkholderia cenocepacia TaxID=95486 RepID=UPI00286FB7C5|nr:DUF1016 N-terminal domain-containing protein [Burkholderia cenocepacia]